MYGPATQCNTKSYYQMFQLSTTSPNLCLQPKSSLINHLINDPLLDAFLTNHHSNVASIHQQFDILHKIQTHSCGTAKIL